MNIASNRLSSQHIAQADFTTAKEVVTWMGAMQAQDYPGALWSIALRTPNLTQKDIEAAISEHEIVRTWPMRGTLHFLAAEDVRWIVALLAPRATAAAAGRRRQLELDDVTMGQSRTIIIQALSGTHPKTRTELCQLLDSRGISTIGQRGIHILRHLSEAGLLCFGPHDGKQPTFVLVDEWLPPTPEKSREESLMELARRYYMSHGPASLRDFAGWGHMTMSDARLGIELAGDTLISEEINGIRYWFHPNALPIKPATYLLPGFDEYILGYKDRSAVLPPEFSNRIVPGGNGMFLPTLVIDGQVVGTWKRVTRTKSQTLQVTPFAPLTDRQAATIEIAAKRYGIYNKLQPLGS